MLELKTRIQNEYNTRLSTRLTRLNLFVVSDLATSSNILFLVKRKHKPYHYALHYIKKVVCMVLHSLLHAVIQEIRYVQAVREFVVSGVRTEERESAKLSGVRRKTVKQKPCVGTRKQSEENK